MNIFYRKPLCTACFIYILASFGAYYLSGKYKLAALFVCIGLFVAFAIIFALVKKHKNANLTILMMALFASVAILVSYLYFDLNYKEILKYEDSNATIEGTVTKEIYYSNYATYYEIDVSSLDNTKVNTRMKMECNFLCPLKLGDSFKAEVHLRGFEDDIDGFPERRIGISKGFSLVAESDNPETVILSDNGKFDLYIFFEKINNSLDGILKEKTDGENYSVISALLLGNKSSLSDAETRDFGRVGCSHLFALSGLHLMIIIGNLAYLLTEIRIRKGTRNIILTAVIIFYTLLTGMQMSMLRAAIMLILTYVSFLLGRDRDVLTSLFVSVVIICMFSPNSIFDIGLQISFLSVFGICVFSESIKAFFEKIFENIRWLTIKKILMYLCMSISISFVAVVSVLPAAWLYFGQISLVSILCNLIFTPFIEIILVLSPFIIIFSKIGRLCGFFVFITEKAAALMMKICTFFAAKRGVIVSLKYPFAKYIILALTVLLAVMIIIKINKKFHFIFPIAAAAIAFVICLNAYTAAHLNDFEITYVNYKSDDGFVTVSDGKAMMCDVSDGSYTFAKKMLAVLDEYPVCEAEVYVLTHYHNRHINTLEKVSDRIYLRELWMPAPKSEDDIAVYEELLKITEKKDIAVTLYEPDETETLDFENVKLIAFPRTYIKRSTQPMISFALENDSSRILYISSSLHESELASELSDYADISDTVVFGSHGPVMKSAFSYFSAPEKLKKIVFANDNVKEFFEEGEDFAEKICTVKNDAFVLQ